MVDEKSMIVVYIPEEEPQNKPIYVKAQGLPKGAYYPLPLIFITMIICNYSGHPVSCRWHEGCPLEHIS